MKRQRSRSQGPLARPIFLASHWSPATSIRRGLQVSMGSVTP